MLVLWFAARKESFSQNYYGEYPGVYKDYGMDSWHRYWNESKDLNPEPTKFDKFTPGAPNYSCNSCYYPVAIPFQ